MSKKVCRGLDKNFIDFFKQSRLFTILQDKEIFLGIRNNYINLYYMGASIGKIKFTKQKPQISIANKYIKIENESGYNKNYTEDIFIADLNKLKQEVSKFQKQNGDYEKIAQQKLVLNNNSNPDSKWYCVDMEYVMQRDSSNQESYGRFDVIAISKEKIDEKHKVALVELKYGSGAYGGFDDKFQEAFKNQTPVKKIGSGILGHIYDYIRYLNSNNFKDTLKTEIVNILKNLNELKIIDEFIEIRTEDIYDEPQVYFITLNDKNGKCEKQMEKYLCNIDGASKYNVEKVLGKNITERNDLIEPVFLFTKDDGALITDVICDEKYAIGFHP